MASPPEMYPRTAPADSHRLRPLGRPPRLLSLARVSPQSAVTPSDGAIDPVPELTGLGPALAELRKRICLVAPTLATVLITGESGTGKERVARAIQARSRRRDQPFLQVNCAALAADLFESEFFGHAKGAFTGALRDRPGRFEAATGGTLFLDEIGELPLALQGKLLRVLQEGEYERVGEDRPRRADVRILAATNRDLAAEIRAGRFRLDLYYRLGVFPIQVPPLRERREDIPALARQFAVEMSARHGLPHPPISGEQIAALMSYSWPGNIRELEHFVEQAVILGQGRELALEPLTQLLTRIPIDLPMGPTSETAIGLSERVLTAKEMEEIETRNYQNALRAAGGKIYGPQGAAALLGIAPTTLASRLRVLGQIPGPTALSR